MQSPIGKVHFYKVNFEEKLFSKHPSDLPRVDVNLKNMGEISFHNYASSPLAQRMVNTGHSVMIDICDVKSRDILSLLNL